MKSESLLRTPKDVMCMYIRKMILYMGDSPDRAGLVDTPNRVLKAWEELFSGYNSSPKLTTFDSNGYDEMVISKNIEYYSFCEHHILPFFGNASIGYIPNKKILGLSKMARIVECYSRRLQNQERLTKLIAEEIQRAVDPIGVGVILTGKHFCMMSRGIQKQNSEMVTSFLIGAIKKKPEARQEFMKLTERR